MAATAIADVIIPEVFADYVATRTAEKSALRQAGILSNDPVIAERANGGGEYVNLPFFNDLTGTDEVLSDSTPLSVANITAGQDVAVKILRGKAWGANDLAGLLSGADPMGAIGDRVSDFWIRREQSILVNSLTGVFTQLGATHTHDVTGASTALSGDVILDGKQLLGDAADELSVMVMHSAKFTALQKANLISYLRDTDANVNFPTYLGYRVIVDDACPVATGNYTTYLMAPGAVAYANVAVDNAVETDRDSLQGDNILITRKGVVMHLRGVKWAVTTPRPANTDLATSTNWAKVYEDKQIRAIRLITK